MPTSLPLIRQELPGPLVCMSMPTKISSESFSRVLVEHDPVRGTVLDQVAHPQDDLDRHLALGKIVSACPSKELRVDRRRKAQPLRKLICLGELFTKLSERAAKNDTA